MLSANIQQQQDFLNILKLLYFAQQSLGRTDGNSKYGDEKLQSKHSSNISITKDVQFRFNDLF